MSSLRKQWTDESGMVFIEPDPRWDNPDYEQLYGPDDHKILNEVRALLGNFKRPNLALLPSNLEIGDFLGLVSNLDIMVTSNSFAFHAAKSQSIPVVTFDNPLPPQEMEIQPGDTMITPNLACGPCYNKCTQDLTGYCMSTISVNQVFNAVSRILSLV